MKRNTLSGLNAFRSCIAPTLWVAVAILFGLNVNNQCSAQAFPSAATEGTTSMGVFRLIVDPTWMPMFEPTATLPGYPGFHTSDGSLTSPVLFDSNTQIGQSNPHHNAFTFPVAGVSIGSPGFDTIYGYSAYPAIPSLFSAFSSGGHDEVLTEIDSFVLSVTSTSGQECSNDTRVALLPPGVTTLNMVFAGPASGSDFPLTRSLGMIQSWATAGLPANDFPARSFFDVFVEVSLPPVLGTASYPPSSTSFPPGGILLSNGPGPLNSSGALIITNLGVTFPLPPEVVYIHGGTTNAVDLYFASDNPGFWKSGDHFGTVILAGHGVLPIDCSEEQALLDAALGPVGHPNPAPAPAWLRPNNLFPSPNSSYNSAMTDTNPPLAADDISFSFPAGGTAYLQNFSLSNLFNNIVPPASMNSVSNSNVVLSCQVSGDNINFFPVTLSGTATLYISNSAPGSLTMFSTKISQLNVSGPSPFGQLYLHIDPTNYSVGQHTIAMSSRGYWVSSFFDVFFDLSTDGVNYTPPNRSIRMAASASPPVPGSLFVQKGSGNKVALSWFGPFTLQGSTNVGGPYNDVNGSPNGPTTNRLTYLTSLKQQFFRLRQ